MKSLVSRFVLAAFAALMLSVVPVSVNATIVANTWYVFDFQGVGSSIGQCTGPDCDILGPDSPAQPWYVDVAANQTATLVFVDAFKSGDTFDISVSGPSTVTRSSSYSSSGTRDSSAVCYTASECLANGNFDSVSIGLTAGTYLITGAMTSSPFGSGAGYFMLLAQNAVAPPMSEPSPLPAGNPFPIPEPTSLALLGIALVGLAVFRRRARR